MMPTLQRRFGWTLAAVVGAFLIASPPALARKKDPCRATCARNNDSMERCMEGCPRAGRGYKKCAEKCNKKAEDHFKTCVKECHKRKSR